MEQSLVKKLKNDYKKSIVIPAYQIFRPQKVGSFAIQWNTCFCEFQQDLKKNPHKKPFIINIFLNSRNAYEFQQFEKQIKSFFQCVNFPLSVISQAPEKPYAVAMEIGFANTNKVRIKYGQTQAINFCKLSTESYTEYWFAGIKGKEFSCIRESAQSSFSKLQSVLQSQGLNFNQIIRQWNSVETILHSCTIENKQRQNYQLFNEARKTSYSRFMNASDFPAATGIGCNWGGVSMNCLLISEAKNLKVVSIGNPMQTNSYLYGQTVLKGDPDKNKKMNQVPQFERAKLISDGRSSRLFISGTASIIGQETIGVNDVEKQTQVTIDNLELLTSHKNLNDHYPELMVFPNKYAYIRVYVKYEKEIPVVKAICKEHFGNIPALFVKADICRDDLLVEIEGEKVSLETK